MSVLSGTPSYPNSKIDFDDASVEPRAIKREDGSLAVKSPYGGPRIIIPAPTPKA